MNAVKYCSWRQRGALLVGVIRPGPIGRGPRRQRGATVVGVTRPGPIGRGPRRQRGATLVSVMLLMISLLTLALLVVRRSGRELAQAGQLVARERALVSAQAAVELAAARYRGMSAAQLDAALAGSRPQGADCIDPCRDCIPDESSVVTGQRNDLLAGAAVACGGRPCLRQGAVARLGDTSDVPVYWCDVAMRELLPGADPEARVSVWIRNDQGDALGPESSGHWTRDTDGRVVLTAMAEVRGTRVTVEQEMLLSRSDQPRPLHPQSPDEGYGGGHNGDNSAVSVCVDDFVAAAG